MFYAIIGRMVHTSRRFFLQTIFTIPLLACSKKASLPAHTQDSILSQFNVPLEVETLPGSVKEECKKMADIFYKNHISQKDFFEQFEKMELAQFQNGQIVLLQGMAISHIMTGFILMSRSQ